MHGVTHMPNELLYRIPIWVALLALVLSMQVVGELARILGRRAHAQLDDASRAQISTIESSLLATLGLLLGFTFAMAISRYDARRIVIVEEANAVGASYLRSFFLREPEQREARTLLRDYVGLWLRVAISEEGTEEVRDGNAKIDAIHDKLWSLAVSASAAQPSSVPIGLFVDTLDEVIKTRHARQAA